MGLLLAFAAAFLAALTVVTQHVASTAGPSGQSALRLVWYLIRSPLWLLGVAAMIGSFVCQALALYDGRLSVVQSILITELVFSLVIGRVWLRRPVRSSAWLSAAITTVGLAIFLVMAEPKGGHPEATTAAWLPALLTWGALAGVCTVLAGRGSPVRRAALYATASGIVSALLATFLKSSTDTYATNGVTVLLSRGPVYGLVVAIIVSTVLTQAALHVGPLGVSQPLMVIVNPVVSVVLGIWLYGEHFSGGPAKIAVAVVGFAAMVVGVVFLARTAPSFEGTPPDEGESARFIPAE